MRVARLAWEYRQTFHKDVVIDMVCYRRHGHNEGDDPSYTQPLMYKAIAERRSVRKLYVESLVKRGDITVEEAEQALGDFQDKLQVALDETRSKSSDGAQGAQAAEATRCVAAHPDRRRADRRSNGSSVSSPHTRTTSRRTPSSPSSSRRARKQFETDSRHRLGDRRGARDRLARARGASRCASPGEDSRRGTFSQRHAALVDFETGRALDPAAAPRRPSRPSSGSTTRCCPSTRRSATSTATRIPTPTRS